MKLGIAVFTYDRYDNLLETLDGLKANKEVKEIYIFQYGLKKEEHRDNWKATKKVISNINWCKVNYINSYSMAEGVNYVLNENDAIIVLEDDYVPMPNFVNFMLQCFEKYNDNKQVYCVSGYSYPINVEKDEYDVYFTGRASTLGWGTWKDRWDTYYEDCTIIKRLNDSQESSKQLATWGNDLEEMLISNIRGENNFQMIYWALNVIEKGGLCVAPYKSLVQNIGFKRMDILDDIKGDSKQFELPDITNVKTKVKIAFAKLYGCCTAVAEPDETKEKVLIYGVGNCYRKYEKELNQKYNVVTFIDRKKRGWYAGKKIISLHEISEYTYDKIIIMIQNIQECMNIAKKLINEYDVNFNKIELYNNIFKEDNDGFSEICILEDGNLNVSYGEITIKVNSLDEYNNVYEGLVKESYHYYINNHRRDIVFDVGMNIGDTTLYFLKDKNVDKVYAYEPFRDTYIRAKHNLKEYLCNQDKIEIFQYGISDENAKHEIGFNTDMSCGQSTISNVSEEAHRFYENSGLILKENDKTEMIEVRKASDVFMPIIEKHTDNNIVLKMNCEGEEYNIIKDLSQTGVIKYIDFIIMEWHYKGKEILLEYLKQSGFSYCCSDKNSKMGWIYAYKIKL
jgi:FkbM family methyltransferase